MRFKPATWFPIAAVLSAVNLAAVWFAAQPAEPWHATGHAVLAVAFGLWAQRLRQRRREETLPPGAGTLELEVDQLRQELNETQERLDFAERIMAQNPEYRRVDRDG
jgi:hypothetical protein